MAMISREEWKDLCDGGKVRYNDILRNIENIKVLTAENEKLKMAVLDEVKHNNETKKKKKG